MRRAGSAFTGGSATPRAWSGEVDVLGQVDYLEVWNHERFVAKLQRDPFTNDDSSQLAEFGI